MLYQFNTMTAKHYSCRHCGVHPFSRPRLDPSRWAVNLRCIDSVDLSALPVRHFDGANWEEAAETLYAQRKQRPVNADARRAGRFPIILSSEGRVMDGMHRVARAVLAGLDSIQAVQFPQNPEPDFVGVDPKDLPYELD